MKHTVNHCIVIAALWVAGTLDAPGAQVWTGPLLSFTNLAGSNPALPANQDRITPNVWITRGTLAGIYNAESESSFMHFYSPSNTAWADGTLANFGTLSYSDWDTWAKLDHGGPSNTIGVNAVMHLLVDDVYLSVQFTSWGGSGGGFSYQRSTPAPLPPVLAGSAQPSTGGFQISFTNLPGFTFQLFASTNITLPFTNWPLVGPVTDAPPGSGAYQFTDVGATTNLPQRFYRLRWP